MAVEVYTTLGASTLSGSYTSGGGTLSVTSAASFPATGNFRVRVDDEIFKVTSVSGTTFTVTGAQEGTSAANHSSGADITEVVTALAWDAIRSDQSQIGAYASLPSTSGQKSGNRYKCTDSPYEFIFDGAAWNAFIGGYPATLPGVASGWTNINGGSNFTKTDAQGALVLEITRNASLNWRLLTKTATPTTATFFFECQYPGGINASVLGAYFYDGTKLMGLEILANGGANVFRVEKITNVTTDGSTAASTTNMALNSPGIWMRLGNTGSTLTFEWSLDGAVWNTLFSEAVGTYITPTQYGFGGAVATGTAADKITISMKSIVLT